MDKIDKKLDRIELLLLNVLTKIDHLEHRVDKINNHRIINIEKDLHRLKLNRIAPSAPQSQPRLHSHHTQYCAPCAQSILQTQASFSTTSPWNSPASATPTHPYTFYCIYDAYSGPELSRLRSHPPGCPPFVQLLANPNTLEAVNLWDKPVESIRELSFLDHRLTDMQQRKANNNNKPQANKH